MMSKELLLALIEHRSNPESIARRIGMAVAEVRERNAALVAMLPPELLSLMEAFIVQGLTLGYQSALLDVRDDVNGVQS